MACIIIKRFPFSGHSLLAIVQMLFQMVSITEFQYDPKSFEVTPAMKEAFDWDGAFVVR